MSKSLLSLALLLSLATLSRAEPEAGQPPQEPFYQESSGSYVYEYSTHHEGNKTSGVMRVIWDGNTIFVCFH